MSDHGYNVQITKAQGCEQLAQHCYTAVPQLEVKPITSIIATLVITMHNIKQLWNINIVIILTLSATAHNERHHFLNR